VLYPPIPFFNRYVNVECPSFSFLDSGIAICASWNLVGGRVSEHIYMCLHTFNRFKVYIFCLPWANTKIVFL